MPAKSLAILGDLAKQRTAERNKTVWRNRKKTRLMQISRGECADSEQKGFEHQQDMHFGQF